MSLVGKEIPSAETELSQGTYGALVLDKDNPPPTLIEYNFVFGHNGSGKTSLADAIEESGLADSFEIARFDRDFASRVLAQTDSVEGLWVVAAEAKELVASRDELRQQISSLRDKGKGLLSEHEGARARHESFLKPLADEIRTLKRRAFDATSTYSTKHLESRLSESRNDLPRDTSVSADALREVIEQAPLRELDASHLQAARNALKDLVTAARELDVSSASRAQRARWIRRSPEWSHKPGDSCPYCQQPLDEPAVDQIEEERGREPNSRFDVVDNVIGRIRDGLVHTWPSVSDFDRSVQKKVKGVLSKANSASDRLSADLPAEGRIVRSLFESGQEGNEPSWLSGAEAVLGQIEQLLRLISDHNESVANQAKAKQEAFGDYETVRLRELHDEYRQVVANLEKTEQQLMSFNSEIGTQEAELDRIEREIRGLLDPQVLNDDLARYLGHRAIRFETQRGLDGGQGYQVVRADGRRADRLSEGENTAIALLYFLRSLREAERKPDVIVIDDPVTSLDDSGVFTAHSFIKDAVARPHGQKGPYVIVTSHNHAYFRLLAEWSSHLNRDDRDRAQLFETVAYVDEDHRTVCRVRKMAPGIAHAGSEYSILLSRLVEYSKDIERDDAYELFVAPNVARRILEGFLTFKYGGPRRAMIGDLLVLAFNDSRLDDFGAERRERLHKLLNSSSHGSGLADTYTTIASRTEVSMVINDVLELIRQVDADHLRGFEE